MHFAAGDLDQFEQLRVLFERQGDVEVIDALALSDLADLGERAEQRQPAIPEVIAARAIVDEADDLIPELAMLQNPVGHHATEIAGAGNQDSLQSDARAPSPLEQLAHRFARAVGEQDVETQEERPHDL